MDSELMDVVLFSDYLKTVRHDSPHKEEDIPVIAKIPPMDDFPGGLITLSGKVYSCGSLNSKLKRLTVSLVGEPPALDSTYGEDEIQCPHCGIKQSDSWEYGDDGHIDCDSCGSSYCYTRDVSVSYSTCIVKRNSVIIDATLSVDEQMSVTKKAIEDEYIGAYVNFDGNDEVEAFYGEITEVTTDFTHREIYVTLRDQNDEFFDISWSEVKDMEFDYEDS